MMVAGYPTLDNGKNIQRRTDQHTPSISYRAPGIDGVHGENYSPLELATWLEGSPSADGCLRAGGRSGGSCFAETMYLFMLGLMETISLALADGTNSCRPEFGFEATETILGAIA
jgi:hypothetical protein